MQSESGSEFIRGHGGEQIMKIYVMTKAKLFKEEIYIGVAKSIKDAEKSLRTS